MKNSRHQNRKAFSLAEAMIAMVVLGIAASGVILPFASGSSIRAEGRHRSLASKLAADMMEEIIASPYSDIIVTYNGLSEAAGQVTDINADVFTYSLYANFSRSVVCQEQVSGAARFVLVTVSVSYNGSEIAVVRRLIAERSI
jgi:prepilin-type N-terminal cleavage/methylation domain-containing protein